MANYNVNLATGQQAEVTFQPQREGPQTVVDTEYQVLKALYNATNGEEWKRSDNWLQDDSIETWYGVETDRAGRVTSIRLNANDLTGRIPPELGKLTQLRFLDLSANRIRGGIPSQLGSLSNLRVLDLNANVLAGQIPTSLGDLANLDELRLSYNRLDESIPSELGKLTELRFLDLASNRLTGNIPPEFGALSGLTDLRLSHNELSGPIPPELGQLSKLQNLVIDNNELSDQIPSDLNQLANLEVLWLNNNKLIGMVPTGLGELENLDWLLINDNRLVGRLPLSLQALDLVIFSYSRTKICVPSSESFQSWLKTIPFQNGSRHECTSGIEENHSLLVEGLPDHPFENTTIGGTTGRSSTTGTFRLGLNPSVFPVIVDQQNNETSVIVAASTLGFGRVVAFSGQDFLNSNDQVTFLGNEHMDRLLANAVRWSARSETAPLRILVDHQRIANSLQNQGINDVQVVENRRAHSARDWSTDTLSDVDVAVVQINEWSMVRVVEAAATALRKFVQEGGGLVIAGSVRHWRLSTTSDENEFVGNAILQDSGISWQENVVVEIQASTATFGLRDLTPVTAWQRYVAGGTTNESDLSTLASLFDSALELGYHDELDIALKRLVNDAPELPTSSDEPLALLVRDVGEKLGPYDWPNPHPWASVFPGLPAADAELVDGTVTIDASLNDFPENAKRYERHFPLGFYAPPSKLVVVDVPETEADGRLAIAIGQKHDDLGRFHSKQHRWSRAPLLERVFPLTDARTNVTNAYGGSMALVVPTDYIDRVPITVRGAIPMAIFTAGQSTAETFRDVLDLGAPQAIMQEIGGIRLVVSSASARTVENPTEVMSFWSGFYQHHAELAGEPAKRAYESIWIFDPQVGVGYANANHLRINYPLTNETWVLMPGSQEGRSWISTLTQSGPQNFRYPPPEDYKPARDGVDWWLFGHELGHQWQTKDWGLSSESSEILEVAVHLFTLYTLNDYLFGGSNFTHIGRVDRATEVLDHTAIRRLAWSSADLSEKLLLYRQLIDAFGWSAFKSVFRSYYDPAYPRSKYGSALDGFAIRFSAVVERDLVRFFEQWEYPISTTATSTIRSFELDEWIPTGW